MNTKVPLLYLIFATSIMYAQSQHEKPEMFSDDPLRQLTRAFPRSIEFKNQGHLIEFCPHNTCDAFSAAASVSERSLEDLAYLYEFYYSGFIYLEDWRAGDEGKADAEQVFAKPEYRHRLPEGGRSAAPCVIEEIGGGGRVRLLFIRYDEHRRNVVPLNLIRELSRAN